MPVSRTAVRLWSALRASGSLSALYDIPDEFFVGEDEQGVFTWLKDFVRQNRVYPTIRTFREETGIALLNVREPLEYYIEKARERALYYAYAPKVRDLYERFKEQRVIDVSRFAREIVELDNRLSVRNRGVVTFSDALSEVNEDYTVAQWSPLIRGVTTGWSYVDHIMGGHQNGDLNTFVGRPAAGKTYTLLKGVNAAWRASHSALMVSMEMNALQMARRFVGIETGINPDLIRKGRLSTVVRRQMTDAIGVMSQNETPLRLVVGNFRKSVDTVRALAEEYMPDIIYVDASYLLAPEKKRSGSEGRRETVSDTVEGLARIAKDLNRPVVQTVQFNRQAIRVRREGNSQPDNPIAHLGLHKIGETDVIGQVSSVVIGIEKYDPPYERLRRWMGFLKGREGEAGYWAINYQFNPVNFDVIADDSENGDNAAVDLSWMGA